jgi:hypothetical protein
MRKITLQFSTEEDLWKFWREHLPPTYSVNLAERLLTQKLSEEQVQFAISEYGAIVIGIQEHQ